MYITLIFLIFENIILQIKIVFVHCLPFEVKSVLLVVNQKVFKYFFKIKCSWLITYYNLKRILCLTNAHIGENNGFRFDDFCIFLLIIKQNKTELKIYMSPVPCLLYITGTKILLSHRLIQDENQKKKRLKLVYQIMMFKLVHRGWFLHPLKRVCAPSTMHTNSPTHSPTMAHTACDITDD